MDAKKCLIVSQFRKNARENLTNASRTIRIPISTIFDRLRKYEGNVIQRHTSLIDFEDLGFSVRVQFVIKTASNQRANLQRFLHAHPRVNSLALISNGFDFLVEVLFKNMLEITQFIESLERFELQDRHEFFIVKDLKKEEFLADPHTVDLAYKDL